METRKEALSATLAVNVTQQEKMLLKRLAYERGATLTGTLRRLIRDAAKKELAGSSSGGQQDYAEE